VKYANINVASKKLISAEIANNPSSYPSVAEMATMIPPKALTNDIRRLESRAHTAFKTGL